MHPVGLPHGPTPPALERFMDGKRGEVHHEVAVMADFANPAFISDWALGQSRAGYMDSWAAYASGPRFAYSPTRLDEVRALADRLADARDTLRPPDPD